MLNSCFMMSLQGVSEKENLESENFSKTILCELCLNVITYTHSEVIEEVVKEILEILLPNLSLEKRNEYRMCKACRSKLFAAYTFKATCMDTEDIIFPHVSTDKESAIEVKEVYLKINGSVELTDMWEKQRICRLCLQLVTYGFVSLSEVDNDIINTYIPQVNVHVVKNPVICVSCFNSLRTHGGFLRTCLKAHEKCKSADSRPCIKCEIELEDGPDVQMIYKTNDKQFYIKSEEIEIKTEEENQDNDTSLCLLDEKIIENKREHISEDIAETKYKHEVKCEAEDQINKCVTLLNVSSNKNRYKIKSKDGLKHKIVQQWKYSSEIQIYKCDLCDYESKHNDELKLHQLSHKGSSEMRMYKCNICTFETKYKYCLKCHQLMHKEPSEIQMYKCDACTYETKYKSGLKTHQLKHKDPCEIQMYKCDFCTFETKHKRWLMSHQLIHKDPSEIQMFRCDACNFETNRKSRLKIHQLLHKNATEIEMYKCELCTYETKYRSNLKKHQLKHKNSSDVQMYKCNFCAYVTRYKSSLINHQIIHKDPSEIQMYKCHACDYEFKRKIQLIAHQLVHKNRSKIQMYKCEFCTFETKYKNNWKSHQLKHKDFSNPNVSSTKTQRPS